MRHHLLKALRITVPLCGVLVMLAYGSFPAQASTRVSEIPATAEGYTFFGPVTIDGHQVFSGELDHITDGSGLTVNDESGAFEVVGLICNWNVNFAFFDVHDKQYHTTDGKVNGNCTAAGERIWYAPGGAYKAKTGQVCATLYSNGIRVVRGCNSIHP